MAKEATTVAGLSTTQRRALYTAYTVIAGFGAYFVRGLAPPLWFLAGELENIGQSGSLHPGTAIPLRKDYTGVAAVDEFVAFFVAAFFPMSSGLNSGMHLQLLYFLLNFTPVVAIMAIESARQRNSQALLTYTTIWALLYQTVAGAVIIPLWCIFFLWSSADAGRWYRSREIPIAKAKTLPLALVVGYLIPTAAFAYPFENIRSIQAVTAFWQISPILVNLIWVALYSTVGSISNGKVSPLNADRPSLTLIYAISGLASFVSHMALLYKCFTSDDARLSLRYIMVPEYPAAFTFDSAIFFIFKADFAGIFAPVLLLCYQAKLELINMGRAPFGPVYAFFSTIVGAVVFGPGTAISAIWWWRESQIDAVGDFRKSQ